jgi:hypothetical protein
MEALKVLRTVQTALSAPACAGEVRFYHNDRLIARKASRNIQVDLLLVWADCTSELRQAPHVTYSFPPREI